MMSEEIELFEQYLSAWLGPWGDGIDHHDPANYWPVGLSHDGFVFTLGRMYDNEQAAPAGLCRQMLLPEGSTYGFIARHIWFNIQSVASVGVTAPAFPCPVCGKEMDHYRNVGREQFGVCLQDKVYFALGSNLFSSWKDEGPEVWEENKKYLSQFELVEEATIF